MNLIKLHKESLIDAEPTRGQRLVDAGLSVLGGVIGGVATGAFLASRFFRTSRPEMVSRWLRTQHHGQQPTQQQEGK